MSRSMVLLMLSAAICLGCASAQAGSYKYPTMRIPKVSAPPSIDGKIDPGEWKRASAFTGLVSSELGGGIVPNIQQVTFYLAYDDKYVYLGMHSPHKEGTYPKARYKGHDEGAPGNGVLLFEDHIEWQICKYARNLATKPGFGFYKVLVNPRGALDDRWYFNGTIGTEQLWDTGGTTKCTVTPTYWDLEMSVEISQLGEKSLDGKDWVMWLVRSDFCNGVYFITWGPGFWMGWDQMPQVIFDPSTASCQLQSLGDLMDGNLGAKLAFNSNDGKPHSVSANFKVMNASGKELYSENKSAQVPAGGQSSVDLTKPALALDDKGNKFVLDAREGDKVLYHVETPVTRLTDTYKTKYLEPWLAARPQSGEWDYRFAYKPYSNVADCSVDLDFFGVPKAISSADTFKIEILSKGDKTGHAIASGQAKIKSLAGATLLKLPELKDGAYTAKFALISGGKKVGEKQLDFVRKHYPWEHNTVGIADEVIPPYEPIRLKQSESSTSLSFWARDYVVGDLGLPRLITLARRELGGQKFELISSPVRLEVKSGGKDVSGVAGPASLTSQKQSAVSLVGEESFGTVKAKANVTAEYDGWYEVALTLSADQPTNVDSVDLVVDLGSYADALYVHRATDAWSGNYFGKVPDGTGAVWQSTSLPSCRDGKDWKSFVPVVFLGTGNRGMWFYSWSDKGWQLSEKEAAVRVERDASGKVSLRVRFISDGVIGKPTTLKFALMAAPVKPLPDNYRNWNMAHDTSGYRYYGDSVDGYSLPSAEHYEMLRKTLLYGPQTELARKDRPYMVGRARGDSMACGIPNVLYGSTRLAGAGMEEYDTFGGEWLGRTNWDVQPDLKFNGRPNYSGSVIWDNPRKMTVVGLNFCPSEADAFVWYHKKLLEVGVNGTWLDNCSIGVYTDYDPSQGKMDWQFETRVRRDMMKRLSTAAWQLMRPPVWLSNLHDEFSFTQAMWLVENEWYISTEGYDYLDSMTLDQFRAMACPKSMQLPCKPWLSGGSNAKTLPAEVNDHIERSKWGVCLLHDIHNNLPEKVVREMNYFVDYQNAPKCPFRGYWDITSAMIDTGDPAIKVSIYSNPTRKNLVMVLMNTGDKSADLKGLSFSPDLIRGEQLVKAYDLDRLAPLEFAKRGTMYSLQSSFPIERHGVRLIGVGAEK